MIENGWTDELFPADEALRIGARATRPKLLLGDLGHGWAHNPRKSDRVFNDLGAAFFRSLLQRDPGAAALPPDVQVVRLDAAPRAPSGAASAAPRWRAPARPGRAAHGSRAAPRLARRQRTATAAALNGATGDWCKGVPARREPNTATYQVRSSGFTLLGSPVLCSPRAHQGKGGQLDARLWEVRGSRQRLITRGLYRLSDNQRGRIRFELHPNAYRFGAGHALQARGAGPRRALRAGAEARVLASASTG